MGFSIGILVLVAAVLFSGMLGVDIARSLRSFDVPTFFAFGDSLADVGTNNYLSKATFKANFPPYGKTFFGRPTGHFSNDHVVVDFLAEALRLPFAPPFLQLNASFTKGVNFASGGSGLLDSTRGGLQLGVETTNTLISKSIFFIVNGSNDLTAFLSNTTFQQEINATNYLASAMGNFQKTLLALYNEGARKVVVRELGPIGCSPVIRSLKPTQPGECLVVANQLVLAFNAALRQLVDGLHATYPKFHIVIGFMFDAFSAIIADRKSFSLTNVTSGCCGAGFLNAQVQCRKLVPPQLPNAVVDFCKRPSKSLYWDFVHPSEVVVRILFKLIYTRNATNAYPINVKALAEL